MMYGPAGARGSRVGLLQERGDGVAEDRIGAVLADEAFTVAGRSLEDRRQQLLRFGPRGLIHQVVLRRRRGPNRRSSSCGFRITGSGIWAYYVAVLGSVKGYGT
jgi:hypothetical protein